jgi:hypothetical protein
MNLYADLERMIEHIKLLGMGIVALESVELVLHRHDDEKEEEE